MLVPGTIVGNDFRVVKPLSEGGMGAVYVAEQLSTGRLRALKLMKAELASNAQFRARFELEARAGSRIASEHVVEVVAAGITDDGKPWLAMELLTGTSLDEHVRERRGVPLGEAQTYLGHICHAIGAAHRVGIVHRDLKPENAFVAQSQREGASPLVKVLDFGIAKVVAEVQGAHSRTDSIGTPLWMAPEQADPHGVISPATDIWPLGLIAFYMLTGTTYWFTPLAGGSIAALIREIALDPLVPASVRAAQLGVGGRLPAGFDEWFARCVARDPAERFTSVDELKAQFAALRSPTDATLAATVPHPTMLAATAPAVSAPLRSLPPSVPPASRPLPPKRGLPLAIGVVALFVVVIFVQVYIGVRNRLPHDSTEARLQARLNRATFDAPTSREVAGDLLSLSAVDPRWGAEKPLLTVVAFCSLTDPLCAANMRELDALANRSEQYVQVRWRHAVPRADRSARNAAEAAQGIFECSGAAAFLKFRDLAFAHHGPIGETEVVRWAKESGAPDPEDFVIRWRRGEWSAVVARDSAAYAEARISTPGFMWGNCVPWGLTTPKIDDVVADAKKKVLAHKGTFDLGAFYLSKCGPMDKDLPLLLGSVEISPFAAPGSEAWARRVVLDWATAMSAEDEAALATSYGPKVVMGGKESSRDDVIRTKRKLFGKSRFVLSADLKSAPAPGNAWRVETLRAERAVAATDTAPATLVWTTFIVRETPEGAAIVEETPVSGTESCQSALLKLAAKGESSKLLFPLVGRGSARTAGLVVFDMRSGDAIELLARRLVDGRIVDTRTLDGRVALEGAELAACRP